MRISKKILAALLAALMAISMMPFTAFADGGMGAPGIGGPGMGTDPIIPMGTTYEVADGASLRSTVANASAGDTIKFTADITFTEAQVGIIVEKDLIFDLNGQTITSGANGSNVANDPDYSSPTSVPTTVFVVRNGATAEFKDSVGGGSWTFSYSGSSSAFFADIRDNSTVRFVSGTYTGNATSKAATAIANARGTGSVINVSGGTFNINGSSKRAYGFSVAKGSLRIDGGTFTCAKSTDYIVNQTSVTAPINIYGGSFNGSVSLMSSSKVVVIYGGTFKKVDGTVNTGVINYTADAYLLNEETGMVQAGDATAIAKVGNALYYNLSDAVAAVANSGTIKLINDATVSSTIEVTDGKKFTINLNGNDIYASTRLMNIRHGNVSISGTGNVNANFSNANSAFAVYGSANSSDANYSVLTIQTSVVINSDGYGAMIGANGSASFGASLTVYGTINSKYGIYANGNIAETNSANAAKVTVGTTSTPATISASNADSVIYAAGYANWTINNANLTGGSAIYIKSGTMTINNGTFTANAAKTDYSFNTNGCDSTGDCVIIDSCGYPGSVPTVTIKKGSFTSANGAAIASYCKQDDDRYSDADFPRVANVVPGTSTATFSSDVSTLCEAGYKTVFDSEKGAYCVVKVDDTMSIEVDDNIDLKINMDTTDERIETIEYSFTNPDSQDDEDTKTVTVSAKDAVTSFTVALAPAQVMDTITAVAKDAKGETIREVETSIASYCNTLIGMTDAQLGAKATEIKELAKSTLDYGKAASSYFEYNEEAFEDVDYNYDEVVAPITYSGSNTIGANYFTITSVSYVATTVPELCFYIANDQPGLENFLTELNNSVSSNIGTAQFVKIEDESGIQYMLQIKGIDICDFAKQINVKVYGDTNIISFVPISWAKAAATKGEKIGALGQAICNYYIKSVAYFG